MNTNNDISDEELLTKFAKGDRISAIKLTRRYSSKILNLAYRMLGEKTEAEDIVQEVFIKLWKNTTRFDKDRGKVSTWIFRVTTNSCIDLLRKRKKNQEDPLKLKSVADFSGTEREENLKKEKKILKLFAALEILPPNQRAAIVLKNLELKSIKETALIMNLSGKAVESLLSRGRKNLRDTLSRPEKGERK